MNNVFEVGKGFRKLKLDEALNGYQSGDTIRIAPGEYYLDKTVELRNKKLKIEGTGKLPSDVKIYGKFVLFDGAVLDVLNLSFHFENTNNGLNLKNNSHLLMNRVMMHSIGNPEATDTYPLIYADSSSVDIQFCEIYSTNSVLAINAGNESKIFIARSVIQHLFVTSKTKVQIENSQVLNYLALDDSSILRSESSLYLTSQDNEKYSLCLFDLSQCTLNNVIISDKSASAKISDGLVRIKNLQLDEMTDFVISHNDQSTVDILGGASAQLINTDDEEREERRIAAEQETAAREQQEMQQREAQEQRQMQEQAEQEVATSAEETPEPQSEIQEQPTQVKHEDNESETTEQSQNPLAKLNDLYGLKTVKEQVQKFINTVKFNKSREEKGLKTTPLTLHSMFLGNPGTGKTTVARLLGDLLYQEGVIEKNTFVEVTRNDLVSQYVGGTAKDTTALLEKAHGGILFIDEAYTLYSDSSNNSGTEAVDTILKYMEDHRNDIMIIFAGYDKEMHQFIQMNPGLKSRVPNVFDFEDYEPEEIAEIGYKDLLDSDYAVDETRYKEVVRNQYMKSTDSSNARWVRNFNQQLTLIMADRVIESGCSDNETILIEDLDILAGGNQESKDQINADALSQLDRLIGLANVKEYVHTLSQQAKVDRMLEAKGGLPSKSTYHMVFEGNPGTGKTMIANLLAKLFYSLDILPTDTVHVVDRSDLVGSYIGHTEKQTKEVLERSMGGVLFIDEAYQLSSAGGGNDFGKQAVETLITYLENYRDKFIVILAGYTENMESFLDLNPGLRSRIPEKIVFPDYTPEEVGEITSLFLGKDWQFDDDYLRQEVAKVYAMQPEKEKGNGRWGRNFAERLIGAHKVWLAENDVTESELKVIHNERIDAISAHYLTNN